MDMTFRDLIEGLHQKDASVHGGALAGVDGLVVEEWQISPESRDLAALCAEMAQFYKESVRIAGEYGLGPASELLLAGEQGIVLVRKVTEDYILLLVADPGAVPGKCRFYLRLGARRAKEML
jgi:predicted regulator of Ras-like GTPase activity (Roadblock/LC7/MglB family)